MHNGIKRGGFSYKSAVARQSPACASCGRATGTKAKPWPQRTFDSDATGQATRAHCFGCIVVNQGAVRSTHSAWISFRSSSFHLLVVWSTGR